MFKGVDAFSGLDVPDADRFVIAPRRQVLVVRTEVQAFYNVAAVATCQLHCNGHERPLRGRFTKSVASETAKQGLTKVPVSLDWAGRIGLLKGTPTIKVAGASFVVLAAMVLSQ